MTKHHLMGDPVRPGRLDRRFEERVERRGLRPRFAAYLIVASWGAGVVIFGVLERLVDPKTFDTVWLGMWWAIQTVTTVGYGDVVPDQTAGKVIAAVLMLGGLSLYAVVTGVITSIFVSRMRPDHQAAEDQPAMRKLQEMNGKLEGQLEAIRADLARIEQGQG
jgi:voltage-gated potassium channel